MTTIRVAAVQMTSGPDREANLAEAAEHVAAAAGAGAELVALPELVSVLGRRADLVAAAEPLAGPTTAWAAEEARRHGVWLVAGSFVERHDDGRLTNTSCLVSPTGDLVATYRKIHLFDVDVPGAEYRESSTFAPGEDVVVADAGPLRVGMAVCYDLRFPELFRILALRGATVVVLPSAFTARTGPAHWEVLVRARAVEDQVFVVAPGQCGTSPGALAWHGHSLVVDPWGTVLADGGDRPGHVVADLDLDRLADVRARLPSLANRRPTTYRWPGP